MFKKKIKITQIIRNKKKLIEDFVVIERPINIFINSKPLATIICLPKDLKELAIGFLFSIGLIDSINNVSKIDIDKNNKNIEVNLEEFHNDLSKMDTLNSLGRIIDTTGGISSTWKDILKINLDADKETPLLKNKMLIKADMISRFIDKMQSETILFKETGGCHGCAIFGKNEKILTIMEDIGRHNAIDKAIGDLLLRDIPFDNVVLCSTGRLTGDSVFKALRAQIPIVASISAAIKSGIQLALSYGTTLIGFVREDRMNIYSHPFRIQV